MKYMVSTLCIKRRQVQETSYCALLLLSRFYYLSLFGPYTTLRNL